MNEEIFTRICDITIEGSTDFFNKYCHVFTDDEENPHEFKQIHDMYLTMLDQKVDQVLKESFYDVEIADFYNDFSHNSDQFRGMNEDAYELVCGTTDFQAFKDRMLLYKRSNDIISDKNKQIDNSIGSHIGGAKTYNELAAEDPDDPQFQWMRLAQFDAPKVCATIHRKHLGGSDSLIR